MKKNEWRVASDEWLASAKQNAMRLSEVVSEKRKRPSTARREAIGVRPHRFYRRRTNRVVSFVVLCGVGVCLSARSTFPDVRPKISVGSVSDQSDADIVKSFKGYAADFIASYKTDRREYVGKLGGGWAKIYFEPSLDYGVDVRKTDSLVSPYVGVLEFTLIRHFTKFHPSESDAEADNSFVQTTSTNHRHTYAFQDNKWVPKSRENYSAFLNEWFACEMPSDGCFEHQPK